MLWKMGCCTLQSMGRTNHKFPINYIMQHEMFRNQLYSEFHMRLNALFSMTGNLWLVKVQLSDIAAYGLHKP